jgi:hypothetical protein
MEKNEDGYIKNFLGWDVVNYTENISGEDISKFLQEALEDKKLQKWQQRFLNEAKKSFMIGIDYPSQKTGGDMGCITKILQNSDNKINGLKASSWTIDESYYFGPSKKSLEIESVEFINTTTIVHWNDGTKTVAVARNEEFNDEKGLAMAIVKKFLGNYTKFDKAYKNAERKMVTKLTRKERKALQTNMETPRTMEEFLSFDLGAEESKG